MFNSTGFGRGSGRGFGRRGVGTVTVIETKVHRSSARNARLAFWLTWFVVGLLAMTIAADRIHPILALLLGFAIGTATGAVVWALVRIWPLIRLIWWWTPEISLALGIVYGWTALARATTLPVRLAVVAVLVGVPAAWPWLNRRIRALSWCVVVRHRLRTCFAQFIIANQSGSLPFIFLAKPTPVGERVWIYLRPGLSLPDLESRLDKIAVACHASSVIAERAGTSSAAFVRLDIKRREVLDHTVDSPLAAVVDPDAPTVLRPVTDPPTALDLPDVQPANQPAAVQLHPVKPTRHEPAKPAPMPSARPVLAGADGEDISDYID
jgi:hypothetical protein